MTVTLEIKPNPYTDPNGRYQKALAAQAAKRALPTPPPCIDVLDAVERAAREARSEYPELDEDQLRDCSAAIVDFAGAVDDLLQEDEAVSGYSRSVDGVVYVLVRQDYHEAARASLQRFRGEK